MSQKERVRTDRRREDYDKLLQLVARSGEALAITWAEGDPPHSYELVLRCPGVTGVKEDDSPILRDVHKLEITLPSNYPDERPQVRMLSTPNFHPHIWPDNRFCLGQQLTPNVFLDELVRWIGGIIQYDPRLINERSPANSTALDWARRNMHRFPVGRVTFEQPGEPGGEMEWQDL